MAASALRAMLVMLACCAGKVYVSQQEFALGAVAQCHLLYSGATQAVRHWISSPHKAGPPCCLSSFLIPGRNSLMQAYDIFMVVVLAAATIWGLWKGLAWQVASLGSIFLSYFVASQFCHQVAAYINTRTTSGKGTPPASFLFLSGTYIRYTIDC